MKKNIFKVSAVAFVLAILLALLANMAIQRHMIHDEVLTVADGLFEQIDRLVQDNSKDIAEISAAQSSMSLNAAKIAAYILSARPELETDLEGLRALAQLLQVDELHLFSPQGEIYFGTHPEYYHLTVSSGQQIGFFAPMLDDHSLELCQEVTPNTAEGRLMQYAAVWSADGERIVQIGLEPERVRKAMEGRTLESIVSKLPLEEGTDLYIIDPDSHQILATTVRDRIGMDHRALGLDLEGVTGETALTPGVIAGQRCCVCSVRKGDTIMVHTTVSEQLHRTMWVNNILMTVYMSLIGLVALVTVLVYLDRKVIVELGSINRDLTEVGRGRLERLPARSSVPELEQLCRYIDSMMSAVMDHAQKLSIALECSQMPIGIVEYSPDSGQGVATSRVKDILLLPEERAEIQHIAARIAEIKQTAVSLESNVYELPSPEGARYIRMEEVDYKRSHLVILVDVTKGWQENMTIRRQRDIDQLTGQYNRWGFYTRLDRLLEQPEQLGFGAMVMLDSDGLKAANDTYGHKMGDRYLKAISDILSGFPQERLITARLGGDEFVAFFYGYPDRERLEQDLEQLAQEDGKHSISLPSGEQLLVRFSLGCACFPQDSQDRHVLLQVADERMYANKLLRKDDQPGSAPPARVDGTTV